MNRTRSRSTVRLLPAFLIHAVTAPVITCVLAMRARLAERLPGSVDLPPCRFETLRNREVNDMFRNHASLKILTPIFLALSTCGCSTVQTTDLPPAELQEEIASGQLVRPGDHVTVTTIQGIKYKLEITGVTENSIEGLEDVPESHQTIDENANVTYQDVRRSPVEIPLAEISAVETRELTSVGQAAAATGAVVAVGGIMYFMYVLLPTLLVTAAVGL